MDSASYRDSHLCWHFSHLFRVICIISSGIHELIFGQKVKYKWILLSKFVNILLMLCCMVFNILGEHGVLFKLFWGSENKGSGKTFYICFEKRGISYNCDIWTVEVKITSEVNIKFCSWILFPFKYPVLFAHICISIDLWNGQQETQNEQKQLVFEELRYLLHSICDVRDQLKYIILTHKCFKWADF